MATSAKFHIYNGSNWVEYQFNAFNSSKLGGYLPSAFRKTTDKITTTDLVEPNLINGVSPTEQGIIEATSADRLAFLPGDQIIVEQSTDGGATWVTAGMSDLDKRKLFVSKDNSGALAYIPLKNGSKSCDCMLRITITGMKYNVPDGTAETELYNYWNSSYIKSNERYFDPNLLSMWFSSNADRIQLTVQRATGANPNNWITEGTFNQLSGWSGRATCKLSGATFGGGTSQTSNYWNWRFIFRTQATDGTFDDTKLNASYLTTRQQVFNLRLFSKSCWTMSHYMMRNGHIYDWDVERNVFFPANINGSSAYLTYCITSKDVLPETTNSSNVGWANRQFYAIYGKTLYEDGVSLSNKYQAKGTTTTIFSAETNISSSPAINSFTSKSITLTSSVQAGDKLKVYLYGGSGAPHINSGIIEFELFNPTTSSLSGTGTIMLSSGPQHYIVTAYVSTISGSTSTNMTIVVHTLDSSISASAEKVNLIKVERIR